MSYGSYISHMFDFVVKSVCVFVEREGERGEREKLKKKLF